MYYLKLAAYNFLVLFILFLIVEIAFRFVNPDYKYYERTYVGQFENSLAETCLDTNWVKKDPALGWVCKSKSNLNFYDSSYHCIQYAINPQGFRNPYCFDSLQTSARKKILLIGDSFLFGIFLEEEETIRAQLQEKLGPNYRVITLAVPAWGLDQMYMAYQKYLEEIRPDEIILNLIDDDFSRTIEALYWGAATKPAFKLVDGTLEERTYLEGKLNKFESTFVYNSKVINSLYRHGCMKKAKPVSEKILKNWLEEEQSYGRNLKVLHFPRIEQIKQEVDFQYDFKNLFKKENYKKIDEDLLRMTKEEQSKLYIPGDGHPSKNGADFIASKMKEMLISQ